jgi:hypothetical protein
MNNSLQKGSLTILDTGTRLIWIYTLFAIVFTVIILVFFLFSSNEFTITVPVKFDKVFIRDVPRIDGSKIHRLVTERGTINVHMQRTWLNFAILLSCLLVLFTGAMIVIYQIKNIIRSFRQGKPFDKLNLKRLRTIAFLLIGYFLGNQVYIFITGQILSSMLVFKGMKLAYDRGFGFLIVGLVLLTLEAAFKKGADLEEEEKLTI